MRTNQERSGKKKWKPRRRNRRRKQKVILGFDGSGSRRGVTGKRRGPGEGPGGGWGCFWGVSMYAL